MEKTIKIIGQCLSKDINALYHASKQAGYDSKLISAII